MTYTIQQVAKKMNITTYSIRYYDGHGMLPFVERDPNNNRVFHDVDLEWLRIIICLRSTGMPVERIQYYLDLVQQGPDTVPERYEMMKVQREKTRQEIENLKHHLETINMKVDHYSNLLKTHEVNSYLSMRP